MKSKYAELFTAKLNDMDLVLFEKHRDWDKWALAVNSDRCFMVSNNFEYFLCLPQHKEAVLNCLNGGESQVASISSGWLPTNCGDPFEWGGEWWYMNPNGESRIKPKKEKRWIATFPWSGNDFYVTPESFANEGLLNDYVDMHYGRRDSMVTHEIEVEV